MKDIHGNKGNSNAQKHDLPFDSRFNGHCYAKEKAGWVKQANREGLKLTEWMRKACNEATDSDIK